MKTTVIFIVLLLLAIITAGHADAANMNLAPNEWSSLPECGGSSAISKSGQDVAVLLHDVTNCGRVDIFDDSGRVIGSNAGLKINDIIPVSGSSGLYRLIIVLRSEDSSLLDRIYVNLN